MQLFAFGWDEALHVGSKVAAMTQNRDIAPPLAGKKGLVPGRAGNAEITTFAKNGTVFSNSVDEPEKLDDTSKVSRTSTPGNESRNRPPKKFAKTVTRGGTNNQPLLSNDLLSHGGLCQLRRLSGHPSGFFPPTNIPRSRKGTNFPPNHIPPIEHPSSQFPLLVPPG